nr:callose synthase 9 [Tanacetum cinerariifolium]
MAEVFFGQSKVLKVTSESVLHRPLFYAAQGVRYRKLEVILITIFPFNQKRSVNFQQISRFIQGVAFMLAIAGIAVVVALSSLTMSDILASILAFIPTGWGRLLVDDRFCIYLELAYLHSKKIAHINSLMRSVSAHPRLRKKTTWRKLQV